MSFLGLDIGTTGTKAIIFDASGNVLSSSYREYPLYYPRAGWIELDPEEVWNKVREAIGEAASGSREPVEALAICSQGEAFTPISKGGEILGPSIVTFDNRSGAMVEELAERIAPEESFRITGMPANQISSIYKMMWLKKERPQIYRETWKFLCWEDFAIWKMGLAPTISESLAARMACMDLETRDWSEKILEAAGIERKLLGDIKPAGAIVGEMSRDAAEELRLPKGTKVVSGAHDQPAGALGAGVVESGIGMDATGTVECIAPTFDRPVLNETMQKNYLCCYPHAVGGMYVTLAFNFTGGSLLRWYRDNFARHEQEESLKEGKDVYEVILSEAAREPTKIFVQPHFCPTGTPYFDSHPVGAVVGLDISTTRGQFVRALLEGISYEMKMNIETIRGAGITIEELRAIGGGAKSDFWLQLKADMYGTKIVRMEVTEAACLGLAMLAATADGKYRDIREAVRAIVRTNASYFPDPDRKAYYEEMFKKYVKLYPLLKQFQGLPLRRHGGVPSP